MKWLDGITDSMDMSLQALEVGDGQGGLACCSPWGCKESDTTEWLNWTELNWKAWRIDPGEEERLQRSSGSHWGQNLCHYNEKGVFFEMSTCAVNTAKAVLGQTAGYLSTKKGSEWLQITLVLYPSQSHAGSFFKKRPVLLNALDEAVKMINFTTSQPFEFVMVKDREARRAAVRGVANSRTRLRDWRATSPRPWSMCLSHILREDTGGCKSHLCASAMTAVKGSKRLWLNRTVTWPPLHRTPFLLERMTVRKTRLLEFESVADIFSKMNKQVFHFKKNNW